MPAPAGLSIQVDGSLEVLSDAGAGKSTAIKIFLGLLRPTSGTAMVLGENAS